MSLGLEIKTARKAKGLTQAQLAEAVNVRRHSIISWEANKTSPSPTKREMLEKVLQVNLDAPDETTMKLPPSSINYQKILERSIEDEEFSSLLVPVFNFIQRIGEHFSFSEVDKKGIEALLEINTLHKRRVDLQEELKAVADRLHKLEGGTRIKERDD